MARAAEELAIRAMEKGDLSAVARIERAHSAPDGRPLRRVRQRMEELLAEGRRVVALVAADGRGRVVGYLVGDVRSWEFGSEPAGWIFALGVDPRVERHGLGRGLVEAATRRFAALGVRRVRTMVRRDDVPVLRFFRSRGFTAGPYLELERDAGGT
jgi:ribosomal protein S18 acetylase RimI-like enzyme